MKDTISNTLSALYIKVRQAIACCLYGGLQQLAKILSRTVQEHLWVPPQPLPLLLGILYPA
jgi:hypothetical protein